MAIKESGPTFLAPTLEKAIDILKNSEVFNKFQNQINPDDQVTSELVSSLMNVSVNVSLNQYPLSIIMTYPLILLLLILDRHQINQPTVVQDDCHMMYHHIRIVFHII